MGVGERRLGFPARLRLKQRREFLRVQRGGRKHHLRHFIVFVARRTRPSPQSQAGGTAADSPNTDEASREPLPTRLGITVTRKVGNAVVRNRIKRLVREVFRQHRERLPSGLDLVFVAKQQAAGAEFAAVLDDFETLVRRGDLMAGPPARKPKPSKPPKSDATKPAGDR
jgi:ribonuclease P protein component